MKDVEEKSKGAWRIFSKLGAGYSSSRNVGEIMNNAYACLPVLNADGDPVLNSGYEFTLSVRGSVALDYSLYAAENVVMTAVNETISALLEGRLN
jgi:hypothetical protein